MQECVHISNNIRIKGTVSIISSDSAVRFTKVPMKPYKSDQKYGKVTVARFSELKPVFFLLFFLVFPVSMASL